jgi:hypothetical protein
MVLTNCYGRFIRLPLTLLDLTALFSGLRWGFLSLLLAVILYRLLVYRYLFSLLIAGFYSVYFTLQHFTPCGFDLAQGTCCQDVDLNEAIEAAQSGEGDRPLLRVLTEF